MAAGESKSLPLLTRLSLASAPCVPVIYFGTQVAAAPFYPGYSFSGQFASDLGSSVSKHPWIFNSGIILTGLALTLASIGLFQTFRAITDLRLSLLIALSVAYSGFAAIRSGIYPLPDLRHSSLKFGLTSAFLMPMLMLMAAWGKDHLRGLRNYLLFSILLLVPVILLLERMISIAWLGAGTVQRLLALGTYVPVGVAGAYFLRRNLNRKE